MSTNWIHDLIFGSNESTIKALEKLQQMDAEQFHKVFITLEKLQKGQQINADQLEIAFRRLEELQKRLADMEEKVETLTEAVGEQEKIMATCIIVSAVAAIAITSFVAFCIYQGVKLEKEKEKNSSKDTPGAKLSNVDATDGTEKLQNNLKIASIAA